MCAGDDKNCPEFELHHRKFKETLDRERRSFLRSSFAAAGGAAAMTAGGISLVTPQMAAAAEKNQPAKRAYHHLPANADTVHWGYFSKNLKPQVEIDSGDFITIEALTHHANDDAERMVKGDPGARKRIPVDQGEEGRQPARRRTDGRLAVRAWRRRGTWRAHLHRSGLCARRPGGRRDRAAHHRRCAAALRQSAICRKGVRQQRGRMVGLPLQGPAHRAQAARSGHDLRGRRDRRTQLGESGVQFPDGRRRPILPASCTRPSTIPAFPSITPRSRRTTAS